MNFNLSLSNNVSEGFSNINSLIRGFNNSDAIFGIQPPPSGSDTGGFSVLFDNPIFKKALDLSF